VACVATGDVLELTAVTLYSRETQTLVALDLLHDPQGVVRVDHPGTAEADVHVAEHRDLLVTILATTREFCDALDAVDDDDERTARREVCRASRQRRTDQGRGDERRDESVDAHPREFSEHRLRLREFGESESRGAEFELPASHVRRLVGFDVRSQCDTRVGADASHSSEVPLQAIEVTDECGGGESLE
jgi:hypothetical protein